MQAVRVHVSGRVQGVCFREATRREAERLGVRGWVRNLPDGRVEGHFEGEGDAVDALVRWCRRGPDAARVAGLEPRPAQAEGHAGFVVRRT